MPTWRSHVSTVSRLCFYQTRSAWSMDQGSIRKRSAVHNFATTVTKFCVMWEGLSLPHDTKFGNCRGEIVDRRMIFIWSLIHGSGCSGLIKVEPVCKGTHVKLQVIMLNTLRSRQNYCHFADYIFKFLNEHVRISLKISLPFVPKDRINNNLALGLIMAWYRPGDKPLSEPVIVRLPTLICDTRPQWVKSVFRVLFISYSINKRRGRFTGLGLNPNKLIYSSWDYNSSWAHFY